MQPDFALHASDLFAVLVVYQPTDNELMDILSSYFAIQMLS